MREEDLFAGYAGGVPDADDGDKMPRQRALTTMVRREGACLLWLGPVGIEGYPVVTTAGRRFNLKRLIFEVAHRPLLPGELVRHTDECRHRNCIEPSHLIPGSHADNMADLSRRVKAGLPSGVTPRELEFRRRRREAIASAIPSTQNPRSIDREWPSDDEVAHHLSTSAAARNDDLSTPDRLHDGDYGTLVSEERTKEPREVRR